MSGDSSNWRHKIVASLLLLIIVAAVARVAYELLAPLVPWLLSLLLLVAIYALIIGGFGRR